MSADDEMISMFQVKCDGECGRVVGFSDQDRKHDVAARMALFILCPHCMNHPEEVEARIGMSE